MPQPGFETTPADHKFFGVMSAVAPLVILTGFASTYGRKLATGVRVHGIVHVHALVFLSWLVLFFVQVALIARGNLRLHRKLGTLGLGLALVMLVLGCWTAVVVTRDGHSGIPGVEFASPAGFLLLNVLSSVAFCALVVAAWALRRDVQAHKRLMLLAVTAGLMPPGISRLPFVSGHAPAIGALVIGFILVGPLYDLVKRRRVHRAYLIGLPAVVAILPPVVTGVSQTAAWRALAASLGVS